MKKYIIEVEKIEETFGEKFVYAQYDDYLGNFASGHPVFGSLIYAEIFENVADAKSWFKRNEKYLRNEKKYLADTYAIVEVKFTTVESL